ncbi:hypothetical protein IMCC20628_01521 [Hoeflea sp. IMCC20628]|uniref:hypothetical protein n=1 Tax=Hoeflea sp. IMCC20628 TaxID=1620421 RepID=UPI00063BEEB1|nr:hypothetical protein [Hoeflea sp. IMCC20628]AKI00238.1 hypothetical protein IMCC20628_01521 [Hoeflea sp. IMCC20628]
MSSSKTLSRKQILLSIALAGLIGEIAFELYAWLVSPILFDVVLQPSNLVIALTAKLTGVQMSKTLAFPIHFLIGSLGFGLFVYATRLVMPARVWLTGTISGLILWFVAQGMLAPFIGRSFMMDFGTYTQSSFVGHVGMTLLMAHLLAAFLSYFETKSGIAHPLAQATAVPGQQ